MDSHPALPAPEVIFLPTSPFWGGLGPLVFFPLRLWCRQNGLGNVLPMGMDESLVFVLFCFTVFRILSWQFAHRLSSAIHLFSTNWWPVCLYPKHMLPHRSGLGQRGSPIDRLQILCIREQVRWGGSPPTLPRDQGVPLPKV